MVIKFEDDRNSGKGLEFSTEIMGRGVMDNGTQFPASERQCICFSGEVGLNGFGGVGSKT